MRKFWESIYSPNYITGYNPFILKNMNKAIEHMVEAINNRKKIVIYGIPNVDGLCAIASLSLVLESTKSRFSFFVIIAFTNIQIPPIPKFTYYILLLYYYIIT